MKVWRLGTQDADELFWMFCGNIKKKPYVRFQVLEEFEKQN